MASSQIRRISLQLAVFAVLLLGSIPAAWAECSSRELKVTSISPTSGPSTGGTIVTINGDFRIPDCLPVVSVKFGNTEAMSFTVIDNSTITAISPPGTGTVHVTVTERPGFETSPATPADLFTYVTSNANSNTDSQKLRALQVASSRSVAAFSGDAITGAVNGAIGDAFANGGTSPIIADANGLRMNFTAEARREPVSADSFYALAYAPNEIKAPPPPPPIVREWSAWADVRGTGFNREDFQVGTHGRQLNFTAGLGRKLTPDLLVGLFAGYENFKFTMDAIAGIMTGEGGTIGAYGAWRFANNWRADAMFGWSGISYNGTAGFASGAFSGSRWLASGGLTGAYKFAALSLEPSARVYALWERDGYWVDNFGLAQTARNFSVGRVSAGSKAIYPWPIEPGIYVAPYVGFYGDWRFSSDSALPVSAPYVGIRNGWSGRLVTGVTTTIDGGPALSLGGELGGIGAGYQVWTANARAAWPF